MTLLSLTTPQVRSNTFEKQDTWDYLVIDIRQGQSWFISRVFIFTIFLQAMRGVKCIVFVESKGEHDRRLIGLASPDQVRAALGATYPWLEEALSNAMVKHKVFRLQRSLEPLKAGNIASSFVEDPLMRTKTSPTSSTEWTQLELSAQATWEHTQWLTLDVMNKILRKSFFEWDSSHYEDLPRIETEQKVKELIQRRAPFIALINSKNEFQRLIDRQKLAILVGETLIEQ